jgi:PKHD-type hydroxylase
MLLVIDGLITVAELDQLRGRFAKAHFGDGRVTAGALAAEAKRNLQLPEDSEDARAMARLVGDALKRNDKFRIRRVATRRLSAALQPLCSWNGFRSPFGQRHPVRCDDPTCGYLGYAVLVRSRRISGRYTDIEDTYGAQRVKLSAGSLVLYPSSSLHRVEPVTQGTRDVAVFWVQSLVREDSQRSLLFALDQAIQSLRARAPDSPEIQALANAYHNLIRMWAEI